METSWHEYQHRRGPVGQANFLVVAMMVSAEFALLIDCTRPHPDGPAIDRIRRRVEHGVAWPAFLQLAIPHGVLPLAAHNLTLYAADLAPRETIGQLQMHLRRVGERNHRQCVALNAAMRALDSHRLRTLAFKGPTLAVLAYGDAGWRESHDLDLWTAPEDIGKAGEVFRAIGFKPVLYEGGRPHLSRDLGEKQKQFVNEESEVVIELQDTRLRSHFHFCPEFGGLWERRSLVALLDESVPTLGAADLLIALAAHGSKHIWRRLNWVADVAGLIASSTLDWDAVLSRARRWRCERRLMSALALASDLYELPLPQPVEARIRRHRYAVATSARCAQRIVQGPKRQTSAAGIPTLPDAISAAVSSTYHHCRSTDRLMDRISLGLLQISREGRFLSYLVGQGLRQELRSQIRRMYAGRPGKKSR